MKSSVAGLALALLTLPALAQVSLTPPPVTPKSAKPAKPPAADPFVGEARTAVARTLKDPAGAQFQNVRAKATVNLRGEPIQVVCGEVNAKNSYGAFTGFTPWIYFDKPVSVHVLGPDRDIATVAVLKNFCS